MARAETIVQLTDDLRQRLDAEAVRRGISRSALLREAAEAYLAERSEAALSEAIVEGYRRLPQGGEDGWTDLTGQADTASHELLKRLDAEESKAGLPPW